MRRRSVVVRPVVFAPLMALAFGFAVLNGASCVARVARAEIVGGTEGLAPSPWREAEAVKDAPEPVNEVGDLAPADPVDVVKAIESRSWGLLVALLFVTSIWILRRYGGRKWPVLTSSRASALLTVGGSLGAAFCAALTSQKFDWQLASSVLAAWWGVSKHSVFDVFGGSWEPRAPEPKHAPEPKP